MYQGVGIIEFTCLDVASKSWMSLKMQVSR